MKHTKKILTSLFALGILATSIIGFNYANAQFGGLGGGFEEIQESIFYTDGTGTFPSDSAWHFGSTGTPIAKGWFTDLDISGVFTLGGTVGSGGIDLNGEKLTLDANANTSITADTDDQIDIEISGADDFQFTANTFSALAGSSIDSTQTVNQSAYSSVNASQTAETLQDGSAYTGTNATMSTKYIATKFTASGDHTMGDYQIRIKESADITNTIAYITGYIYADDGGSPSKPTGSALTTGKNVCFGTITSSYQLLSIGTEDTLTNGTDYWLVVKYNAVPVDGNIVLDSDVSSNMGVTSADGSSWTNTDVRLRYLIRGRTYYGVYGYSTNSNGMYGYSTNSNGVYGSSTNSYGVYGYSTNSNGMYGYSTNSNGVYGSSTNSNGVRGYSTNSNGVYGSSTNSNGVSGSSTNSNGVYGSSTNSNGVRGSSTTNKAGYFHRDNTAGTATTEVLSVVQDSATGDTNNALSIQNDGTGNALFIDQDGNGRALNIDKENTATTGASDYGIYNSVASSAVVTGTNQYLIGQQNFVTKTGADTNSDTIQTIGIGITVSNTGSTDVGSKQTFGGKFSVTGDTAGSSVSHAVYSAATGSDTNYSFYGESGTLHNVGDAYIGGTITLADYTCTVPIPATTARVGSTAPTATTIMNTRGLGFDADAELAFIAVPVPLDWNGSSDLILKTAFCGTAGDAIANGEKVTLDISYNSVASGEAVDNGTEKTATATHTSTGDADKELIILDITIDHDNADQPLTAGDALFIKFNRDVTAEAGNTYSGMAIVQKWALQYTSNTIAK